MKNRWKLFRTLRSKLLLQNGGLFLVALVLTTAIISAFSIARIRQLEFQSNETYLHNTQHSIDTMLKSMAQVTMFCYSDPQVAEIMMRYDSVDEQTQNAQRDYLFQMIYSMTYLKNEIEAVYVFDRENLIYGYDISRATQLRLLEMAQEPWYEALADPDANRINNCVLIGAHQPEFLARRSFHRPVDYTYVAIAREIHSFHPYTPIGYMLIISPVRNLQQIIERSAEPDAKLFLVDDGGTIICDNDGEGLGMHLDSAMPGLYELVGSAGADTNSSYRVGETEYLISGNVSEYSGWTLITMRPADLVYQETRLQITLNVGICLLMLALSFFVMNWMIKRSLGSLKALSQGMHNAIRRDFRSDVEVGSEDEISQLSVLFNQLMDTVNTLIYSEYESTIQIQNMQIKQKEYQLGMLRSQINPHFLYNTLDTLRMKALINGDKEVADMAYDLADFFRKSVSKDTEMVPVCQEIEFAQLYFSLMQKRYEKLTLRTELDEKLLGCPVPNFILQPILENSLLHGLKECRYEGEVTLRLFRRADLPGDFFLEIRDNGVGMDPKSLERLNGMLESGPDIGAGERMGRLGLDNVQKRLRQYYPTGYGIRLYSQPGRYTVVQIRLQIGKEGPSNAATE